LYNYLNITNNNNILKYNNINNIIPKNIFFTPIRLYVNKFFREQQKAKASPTWKTKPVILLTDVPNLGTKGLKLNAKKGLLRNLLYRYNLAAPATPELEAEAAKYQIGVNVEEQLLLKKKICG